jgi:hypothetical protein
VANGEGNSVLFCHFWNGSWEQLVDTPRVAAEIIDAFHICKKVSINTKLNDLNFFLIGTKKISLA